MLNRWCIFLFLLLCFDKVLQSHAQAGTSKRITIRQTDTATSCSIGWYEFGEMCYKLGGKTSQERRLPWLQASESCRNDYSGHLATIYSKEIEDFLAAFFLLSARENLWIGMNDRENETVYFWDDGNPVTPDSYGNWEPNEPSGAGGNLAEDCIEVVLLPTRGGKPGQWNDVDCGVSYQFICQKEKGKFIQDYSDPRKCPSEVGGGWKKGTSCFHVVDEEKTWSDAEEYCAQNLRGHLATITDFTINLFLNYILGEQEKNLWIGIQTKNQHQQQWSSGWHVSYENWEEGEKPTEFSEGSCVARNRDGKWAIHPCNKMLPFICEYSTDKAPILKPKIEGGSCPDVPPDWRDLGGDYCYYFDLTKDITWYEANFICMRRGGVLVGIHSLEEARILQNFLKFMQTSHYFKHHFVHIGLYRLFHAEEFAWADGTPFVFRNWEVNEPYSENELCVFMKTDTMKWHDVDCLRTSGYICSVLKVFSNQSHKEDANQKNLHTTPFIISPNQIHEETANHTILQTTPSINVFSTSVLAGIIVCVFVVSVLISGIVFYFCFSKRYKKHSASKLQLHYKKHKHRSENGLSDDNTMYADIL